MTSERLSQVGDIRIVSTTLNIEPAITVISPFAKRSCDTETFKGLKSTSRQIAGDLETAITQKHAAHTSQFRRMPRLEYGSHQSEWCLAEDATDEKSTIKDTESSQGRRQMHDGAVIMFMQGRQSSITESLVHSDL
jgi:hypothetical protein